MHPISQLMHPWSYSWTALQAFGFGYNFWRHSFIGTKGGKRRLKEEAYSSPTFTLLSFLPPNCFHNSLYSFDNFEIVPFHRPFKETMSANWKSTITSEKFKSKNDLKKCFCLALKWSTFYEVLILFSFEIAFYLFVRFQQSIIFYTYCGNGIYV